MYVLDTNVISELRKGNNAEHSVRMWAEAMSAASLYLSVVSILELEIGTLLVDRRDPKQGAILRAWIVAMCCLHSPGEFWQLTLWLFRDVQRCMCHILAPIGTRSSRRLRSFMA